MEALERPFTQAIVQTGCEIGGDWWKVCSVLGSHLG